MQRIRLLTLALTASTTLTLPAAAQNAERAQTGEARDADAAPFQLSLWNPVQTGDEKQSVHGMRLNLPYGKNRNIRGFDLGIANYATGQLHGAQMGLGGYVADDVYGLQYNLIFSIGRGHVYGVQEGIYSSAGTLTGVQAGAVNHVRGTARGARFAFVNVSDSHSEGAELGIVNYARRVDGLQFGLVNVTGELHGIQIGLANIATNGFLPFFPVMNAAL